MKKISTILVALLAASTLAACSQTSVFELKVGDCVLVPDGDQVGSLTSTECSVSHDAEVYAAFDTDPSDSSAEYPGESVLDEQAENGCLDAFESYIGTDYMESSLDISWLSPTEGSWENGDREIVCLAYPMDESKLSSSVKGSGL